MRNTWRKLVKSDARSIDLYYSKTFVNNRINNKNESIKTRVKWNKRDVLRQDNLSPRRNRLNADDEKDEK